MSWNKIIIVCVYIILSIFKLLVYTHTYIVNVYVSTSHVVQFTCYSQSTALKFFMQLSTNSMYACIRMYCFVLPIDRCSTANTDTPTRYNRTAADTTVQLDLNLTLAVTYSRAIVHFNRALSGRLSAWLVCSRA